MANKGVPARLRSAPDPQRSAAQGCMQQMLFSGWESLLRTLVGGALAYGPIRTDCAWCNSAVEVPASINRV